MSNKDKVWLSSPHMSEKGYEKEFVQDAFDKNWIAPLGENVNEFENAIKEYANIDGAVALASGTAAIHLALLNIGLRPNDIVFVQSITFAATVNPVVYEKATPIFIDSEEDTWNMDPTALKQAFEKYGKPKAVIVVHLYGVSAKIEEIQKICNEYNTPLIEDAAESLGTIYKGQYSGTFGDYGIYSFNGNKIITTSGGGMLVSNNVEGIEHARKLSAQAREPFPWYEHEEIGYNYRLSNISAGIGRGQMKVLEERVQQKRHIYFSYLEGFKDIPEIKMIPDYDYERSNHWLSAALIKSENITPEQVIDALATENIEARRLWKPMHMQPVHQEHDFVGTGVSNKLFEEGLCFPSDTKMSKKDIQKTIDIVRSLFK